MCVERISIENVQGYLDFERIQRNFDMFPKGPSIMSAQIFEPSCYININTLLNISNRCHFTHPPSLMLKAKQYY